MSRPDVKSMIQRLGCKILLESDDVKRVERITSADKVVIIKILPLKKASRIVEDDTEEDPCDQQLGIIHKKILSVLTAEPQTPRAICRAAGYSPKNNHVRQALYLLRNLGLVTRSAEGYCLSQKNAAS